MKLRTFKHSNFYFDRTFVPSFNPQTNEHIIDKKQKKRTYWDKLSKKRKALYYFLTVVLTIGFWIVVFNI